MISTLGAFVLKEIRHILRDRQTLTILLLMPLVQVAHFGYALRLREDGDGRLGLRSAAYPQQGDGAQ